MAENKLNVIDLHKRYGEHEVLKGVSLQANAGDVISIIGSSGSGKSTFLRCINFLEKPSAGKIVVSGENINLVQDKDGQLKVADKHQLRMLRTRLTMVFQHFNLWSHMTVLENVMEAPVQVLGLSKQEARDRAVKYLAKVGIDERAQAKYPVHLSGGQQQRVAIARALMMEPAVLLFDEPTAALDPEITAQIVSIIRELAETNITQVIVTHEVEVARKTASRVVYMENGHIVEQGDASCFAQPQTDAFRNYLSH
ncbi:MAG TPA: histidine/lysine/arginine/ornithine ABC transporter ATP-binding protein [Leclercia adecarboxylata]|nr:histidine/lysine/arginine/ornithine ABC transporter ATP-binding protein [Leclercia adecarboxylata]